MKKSISVLVALLSIGVLLASCSGISQEQYNKVSNDLSAAQSQIQSLQSDKAAAQSEIQSLQNDKQALTKKATEALSYAEFLDVVLYPAWKQAGLTTRFTFASETDWYLYMTNTANNMGDNSIINYIKQVQQGGQSASAAMSNLTDYCLNKIEANLK